MRCFHPILVKQWYDATPERTYKTKSGCITVRSSEVIKRQSNSYHYVPCGRCVACLSRRRNDWTYRLTQEKNDSSYAHFLTLTYDDQYIPIRIQEDKPYFVFNKKHVQDYIKRVRYMINELAPTVSIKYLAVSEYGSKFKRPHYHLQIFTHGDDSLRYQSSIRRIMESEWRFGFTVIKPTADWNIHYVTKYCLKQFDQTDPTCIDPTFMLCSKRPFLGFSAISTLEKQASQPIVFNHGFKQAMPRIYRENLGFPGLSVRQSDNDPRLSEDDYKKLLDQYKQVKGDKLFNVRDFTDWYQNRIKQFELDAIRRQTSREEKL